MKNKYTALWIILVVLLLSISACGSKNTDGLFGTASAPTQPAPPLATSLPEDLEDSVVHPEVYVPESNVYIQIQVVAQDLRDIPNNAWLNSDSSVTEEAGAVALYVKARAGDHEAQDPFWTDGKMISSGIRALAPDGASYSLSGCVGQSFEGDYLPPAPGYLAETVSIQPGETREGWILCAAPNIDIDDQRFVWTNNDSGGAKSIDLWVPVTRAALGAWVSVPTMTVKNRSDESVVYQGNGWFSVTNSEFASLDDSSDLLPGISASTGCSGTHVLLNTGEIACNPSGNNRVARFHVRFAYPGMPIGSTNNPDLYVSQFPVRVGFGSDDQYVVSGDVELPFSGWTDVAAPDFAQEAWFYMDSSKRVSWNTSTMNEVEVNSGESYCEDGRCIGPFKKEESSEKAFRYPPDPLLPIFTRQVRYLCPGESAMGITIGALSHSRDKENVNEVISSASEYLMYWAPMPSYFTTTNFEEYVYIEVSGLTTEQLRHAKLYSIVNGKLDAMWNLDTVAMVDLGEGAPVLWNSSTLGSTGLPLENNSYLHTELWQQDVPDLKSLFVVIDSGVEAIWRLSCELEK